MKPERIYHMTPYKAEDRRGKRGTNSVAFYYRQKLQEEMNIIERRRRLTKEAMDTARAGWEGSAAAQDDDQNESSDFDTDGVDSDDPDIFNRHRNFERLLTRFEKHKKEKSLALKGNDLKYNIYMKKLNKLTRHDLGIDIAAYKDYVNNLKEFAAMNKDLEVFARDGLLMGTDPEKRLFVTEDDFSD